MTAQFSFVGGVEQRYNAVFLCPLAQRDRVLEVRPHRQPLPTRTVVPRARQTRFRHDRHACRSRAREHGSAVRAQTRVEHLLREEITVLVDKTQERRGLKVVLKELFFSRCDGVIHRYVWSATRNGGARRLSLPSTWYVCAPRVKSLCAATCITICVAFVQEKGIGYDL